MIAANAPTRADLRRDLTAEGHIRAIAIGAAVYCCTLVAALLHVMQWTFADLGLLDVARIGLLVLAVGACWELFHLRSLGREAFVALGVVLTFTGVHLGLLLTLAVLQALFDRRAKRVFSHDYRAAVREHPEQRARIGSSPYLWAFLAFSVLIVVSLAFGPQIIRR